MECFRVGRVSETNARGLILMCVCDLPNFVLIHMTTCMQVVSVVSEPRESSLSIEVTPPNTQSCKRVRTSLNIWARVLLQMCPKSLSSQPSDCTPFHLIIISCFSMLKENGSRKTKGQRKEINMGTMPSFAVCDLVYKGVKPALCP